MTEPLRPKDESEFGGAPGLIQPPPHELKPSEEMMLMKAVDPSDPDDSVELQRMTGKYGRIV